MKTMKKINQEARKTEQTNSWILGFQIQSSCVPAFLIYLRYGAGVGLAG
jgi:hypothetical protein